VVLRWVVLLAGIAFLPGRMPDPASEP